MTFKERPIKPPAMLTNALLIATQAHQAQTDKAGQPYILHPLRLMMQFQQEDLQIVALLHDVVEDSDTTLDDLRTAGFAELIVQAVDALTRRKSEDYQMFIARAAKNPLAARVKIADLTDNLDVKRLPLLTEKDFQRLTKYRAALKFLTDGQSI